MTTVEGREDMNHAIVNLHVKLMNTYNAHVFDSIGAFFIFSNHV